MRVQIHEAIARLLNHFHYILPSEQEVMMMAVGCSRLRSRSVSPVSPWYPGGAQMGDSGMQAPLFVHLSILRGRSLKRLPSCGRHTLLFLVNGTPQRD